MKLALSILFLFLGETIFSQCSVSLISNSTYCGFCNGSINSNPSGQFPFSFLWSTGETTQNISGLCPGPYSLIVTDSVGCVDSSSTFVNNGGGLMLWTQGTNTSCSSCCDAFGNITIGGGFPPYSITWSSGQNTADVSGLCADTYYITVIDSMQCMATINLIIQNPPLHVEKMFKKKIISIYPNPTDERFTIEILDENFKMKNAKIKILNVNGNLLEQLSAKIQLTIKTKEWEKGIYFVQLTVEEKIISKEKVIIE